MNEASAGIRSLCVNYCDDIRQEVGNKISLIGVFGQDLIVPKLPAVLPKLCVYAQAYSDVGTGFDEPIEFRVLVDDTIVATAITKADEEAPSLEAEHFHKLAAQIIFSPIVFDKECTLRVRAFFRGNEYKSAGLKVRCADQSREEAGQSS